MVQIGDSVMRTPETFTEFDWEARKSRRVPMRGKVVYIHPKGRFHTVEFNTPGGPIRESFKGVEQ